VLPWQPAILCCSLMLFLVIVYLANKFLSLSLSLSLYSYTVKKTSVPQNTPIYISYRMAEVYDVSGGI